MDLMKFFRMIFPYAFLLTVFMQCSIQASSSSLASDENRVSCQGFTADRVIRDLISSGHATAEPCPCIEQIIEIDETFEKINNCYKQWFFIDGVKQMCCYSEYGQLLIDSPGAGYLLLESYEGYIERAHDICCGNGSDAFKESCESFYQINKPDDCSTYVPPVVSMSSGDPVIKTIDGGEYDFNGHGEYVFLRDEINFEIQARTEYVVLGNNDSTYFSAFALLDIKSDEHIELHYYQGTKDISYYRNGSYNSNCSASSKLGNGHHFPCEGQSQDTHTCFVLAGGGKIIIQNCGFKSYIKQLVFGTDNFMSIQIIRDSKANIANITGLAGHREDGFYITRNNTEVSENASSLSVFKFAESWSLQNESESVFMYNETGENFTTYNTYHTRPEFLEDKLGNLTALFGHFTPPANITLFNKTCRNYWNKEPNNQCLLAIARTGNYNRGLDVMCEANATRYKWEILHNKAPNVSSDFPDKITVSINSTFAINLTDYATDDNTSPENLVFKVVTNVTAEEYSIDNGIFTWNVNTSLRDIDTGIQFIVYDKFNATSLFSFSINYCGCSKVSFCSFNESTDNPSDTVVKASCVCPAYTSGDYCEDIKDLCPNYNCYNNVCNVMVYMSKPSWPCGPCPEGRDHSMLGYNQTCTDIDECSVDYAEADKCEQNCINTDGSFKCSCSSGYKLNGDGRNCSDIDECNQGQPRCVGKNEACVNTPGNYSCICVAGYVRYNESVCEISNGPQFVGNITFLINKKPSEEDNKTIDSSANRQKMQQQLREMFSYSPNFVSVEVLQLFYSNTNRRKRQDSQKGFKIQVKYIVHYKNETNNTLVLKELTDSIQKYQKNTTTTNKTSFEIGQLKLYTNTSVLKVNTATEGGLCKVEGKTDCAKDSTDCNDYNDGTFNCTCKKGFRNPNVPYKYCNDIDECKEFTANSTIKERCIHGVCRNSVGSWNCSCDPGKLWQNKGNNSYPIYGCQGNHSYIGYISIADYDSSRKTNIVELIQYQLKTWFEDPKNENKSYDEPISRLFVNSKVLSLVENMALRHGSFRQYNATFLLRIGEIVHSERLLNVLNGVLREGDCRIRNSSLDVAFENNSYFIFNDYDNKLCEFGSNGNCDKETTTCKQINGSTFCLCKEGFHKTIESMKYCTDIDECEIEKCNNETCVNSYGNWSCQCKNNNSIPDSNDRKIFTCKDVSVCEYKEYKNKNINFKCINGNRTCRSDTQKWECTCEKGLSSVYYDINTFKCEDVDECAETGDICSGHGTCKNKLNGNGYSCNCEKGYKENATNCFNVTCEDINECEASSNYSCLGGGNCNNTIGGWGCLCDAGYQATTISKFNISCEDIDECENNSYYCNGTCNNVMGNWTCTCLEGFRAQRSQNGTRILCIDIDECQENKNCSGHGSCENHPGRFECKCYDGFVFDSSNQTCIDIDECNKPKICGDGGNCTNTLGNYKCTCPKHGYVQQKYHNDSCKDINECTDESYYCGGDCNNTLGSWTCKCKQGYSKESNNETKISITCEDINECDKSAKCVDGVCINLDGSWSCDCQDGKQPERFNSTLTVCRGGFQYIMSTGISVPTSSDVKPKEINIYMKAQIEAIYSTKFHNQHVRVEIISVIRVDSGKRRKRQATESYEIDFVVHFNQSIPHENISQAWTEYIKHNCSTGSNVGCPAPKNVRALPVVFESKISITKDQSAALCNLDKYNHCDPDTSTCHFVNGSANCDCKKGYTKNIKSNLTCDVSKDACQQSLCKNSGTCRMSQDNKSFECLCRDGWTGKYCEDVQVSKTGIQVSKTDDKTILIATTSSLGGLVIILALAMIILCRFKSKKSEDDKMSLKHMDANGFKSFDGALLRNRFVEDDDDGVGSYYSRRLSSSSLPYGYQNRLSGSGNQNGFAHNGLYASPNKLPRANIHGSMPNLAGNGTSSNHFDDRRYSGDEARHVLSYNQGLNRSYDIDLRAPRNNWNGRRSPPPDYGRPRSPKPDYHGRKFNRSKDSGVGNGNSSESNEYHRQENRGRHYYYGQRQSTNF